MNRLLVKPVAIAATIGLALTGCSSASSSNGENVTACQLFVSSVDNYNKIGEADRANRTDQTEADIQFLLAKLPEQFHDALDKASGDIAVKIQTAESDATRFNLNKRDTDALNSMVSSMESVLQACSDAGLYSPGTTSQ